MNIHAACLAVTPDAAPGTYEWGALTGKKVEAGDQVSVLHVNRLTSKLGAYYWIEIAPKPGGS